MSTIPQTSLIPLWTADIGQESQTTVNARELHAFLENGDHFSTWIKDRISQYSFVENQDFTTYSELSEKGRPRLDYYLSLDMAKELAMVERNQKGKEARQYFIACERAAKTARAESLPNFSDQIAAARAWADAQEAKELALAQSRALAQQLETEKPYIELARAITGSSTMIVRDWIALMKEDYNITLKEKQVHGFLHERKYWYWTQLSPRASRAYAEYDHLFKLEKELINGAYREVLKITGEGIRVLTPIVIAHFDASRLSAEN